MARYIGSACKLCRREGVKLFLKGERCFTPKCAVERRSYPPGMHGRKSQYRRKVSDYSLQLREKQKARRLYGIMESQFRRYFREAQRRPGHTGLNLLAMLETRLDNVIYRLGFASSRAQARQLVRHGHFEVDGQKTNVPSFLAKPGQKIAVRERSRNTTYFREVVERLGERPVPGWLSLNAEELWAQVLDYPSEEEIEIPLDGSLIVEYYSR